MVLISDSGLFYHLSDILFALNQNWEFHVETDQTGDFRMGIALPIKRTLGLKRIIQPAFCQQLGIIGSSEKENQDHFRELLSKSKGVISWAYQFNEGNFLPTMKQGNENWKEGINLVLKLDKPIEEIQRSYSNNLSRKLKKARASRLSFNPCKLENILPTLESELLQGLKTLKKRSLSNLMKALNKTIPNLNFHFFKVEDESGELLSGGVFVGFKKRFTYWAGFSTERGKQFGAMAFLIDQVIDFSKRDYEEFDFESGNLSGTSRFFMQFKPEERLYPIFRKGF
jgi:hypothetical protein